MTAARRNGNRDLLLRRYFESRREFYSRLLSCGSIEEMRMIFDLSVTALAVEEWLHFMLMLSLNMQYPGRYSSVGAEQSEAAYRMVEAELEPGVESYLDSIVTNGVFLKSMFQSLAQRGDPASRLYFLRLFQKIVLKFPDVRRWNHFFKRSKAVDCLMRINTGLG